MICWFRPMLSALMCAGCTCQTITASSSPTKIVYRDPQYGLKLFLPPDWKGFSVLSERWDGEAYLASNDTDAFVDHGPIILLRHPRWSQSHPWQDIPILVFTHPQWISEQRGDFGIYAGGFEYEIAHNHQYVFAINNRFNWDDSIPGSDESQQIIDENRARDHALLPKP